MAESKQKYIQLDQKALEYSKRKLRKEGIIVNIIKSPTQEESCSSNINPVALYLF